MQLQYDQILHYMNVPFIFLRVSPLTLNLVPQTVFQKNHNNHFSKIGVKINILV